MAREDIGSLVVRIEANLKNFNNGVNKVNKKLDGLGSGLKKIGKLVASAFAIKVVADFGKQMLLTASDAEEMQSKFNIVFDNMSSDAEAWATNFRKRVGGSRIEIKGMIADSQDLLTGFGATTEQAFDFSTKIQSLGTDLASFQNISGGAQEAVDRLRKGLLGETENLKALGIVINQTALQQELSARGDQRKLKDLSELEKIELRYAIAVKQSKNAIGDAERTSGSFANQLRRLQGTLKDSRAEMGKKLLPIATKFITFINDSLPIINKFKKSIVDNITKTFNQSIDPISEFISTLKDGINDILPEIIKFSKLIKVQIQKRIDIVAKFIKRIIPIIVNAFKTLLPPIKSIISTIITIFKEFIIIVNDIYNNVLVNILNEAITTITNSFELLKTVLNTFANIVKAGASVLLPIIQEILPALGIAFGALVIVINKVVNSILTFLQPVIETLGNSIVAFIEYVTPIWEKLKELFLSLVPLFKQIYNLIKPVLIGLGLIIGTVITTAIGFINGLIQSLGPAIEAIISGVTFVINVLNGLLAFLRGDFKGGLDFFKQALKNLGDVFINIFKGILEFFKGFVNGILSVLNGLGFDFPKTWEELWTNVMNIFSNIWSSMKELVKVSFNGIINIINKGIRALNKLNITVPDWVPEIGGNKFGFSIPEIPKLAVGTNFVPFDTMAFLHKGEAVVPANNNPSNPNASNPVGNINFEKMFEGANFYVRNDNDIKLIAREIFNLQQSRSRGNGVVYT